MLSEDDVTAMLINPIYAISIDPDLVGEYEPIVSKERWIETNEHLIDKIGAETWLRRLLAVLEGDYPTSPNDPTIADGYIRDDDFDRRRNRRYAARRIALRARCRACLATGSMRSSKEAGRVSTLSPTLHFRGPLLLIRNLATVDCTVAHHKRKRPKQRGAAGRPSWLDREIYSLMKRVTDWSE